MRKKSGGSGLNNRIGRSWKIRAFWRAWTLGLGLLMLTFLFTSNSHANGCASLPFAVSNAATGVSSTGATLNGRVAVSLGCNATVSFEYGLTAAYGSTVTASPATVINSEGTSVSATITGLTSNTTYHYRVTAENSAGTSYGADLTFFTGSIIGPALTARSNSPVFEGMTLELYADLSISTVNQFSLEGKMPTSPADWYWVGPNGFISSDQNPTISSVTTAAAGTYTVSFTTSVVPTELMNTVSSISIEDFVPQLESTTEVAVLGNPVAINNGPICEGDMLELSATTINGATYAWTGPNGFTSSLQNPTIENATPQAAGEYSVTATVDSVESAPATTTVVVHPIPETPLAGNNGPLVAGNDLELTASLIANATYAWTGPNGFSSALQNPTIPNATAQAAGEYEVVATLSGCPSLPGTTIVSFKSIPDAPEAGSNSPICEGDMLELSATAIDGATYAWTGPNGFTSSLQNPTIENATPQAAGEYSVTAMIEGVSSAPATTTVVVHPAPAGCTITAPVTVAFGSDGNSAAIVEGSTPGATYTWVIYVDGVLDNSLITAGQNTSEITWSAPAVFETIDIGVVVETANGCVCDNDPPVAGQFPGNGVQIAAQSADIPTVSEWGMILFSLLLAATAVIYMKRKHNQII